MMPDVTVVTYKRSALVYVSTTKFNLKSFLRASLLGGTSYLPVAYRAPCSMRNGRIRYQSGREHIIESAIKQIYFIWKFRRARKKTRSAKYSSRMLCYLHVWDDDAALVGHIFIHILHVKCKLDATFRLKISFASPVPLFLF